MPTQSQLCKTLKRQNDRFLNKFDKLRPFRNTAKREKSNKRVLANQSRRSYKNCLKMPRDHLVKIIKGGKKMQNLMYEGYKMSLKLDPTSP